MPALNPNELFETETMADLCSRQGQHREALQILRRLCETAPASPRLARWRARAQEIELRLGSQAAQEVTPDDVALPTAPGVVVALQEDGVTFAWALPAGTAVPRLELILVQRGVGGPEVVRRRVELAQVTGRLALAVPGLLRAVAAVGHGDGDAFVPLARSPV